MVELVLTIQAEEDLLDIWRYTAQQWGELQANAYLDDLDQGMKTILRHPEIGAECSQIRLGYRRIIVKHHRVFYLMRPGAIEIVRVLHESMDVYRQFD